MATKMAVYCHRTSGWGVVIGARAMSGTASGPPHRTHIRVRRPSFPLHVTPGADSSDRRTLRQRLCWCAWRPHRSGHRPWLTDTKGLGGAGGGGGGDCCCRPPVDWSGAGGEFGCGGEGGRGPLSPSPAAPVTEPLSRAPLDEGEGHCDA